jgi:predicted transcriptional regulator
MQDQPELIDMTAEIVASYVASNNVAAADVAGLIHSVHRALSTVSGVGEPEPEAPKEPAVPIKKSLTPDYLICLEDGRRFKSLKRHLRTKYDMSPEQYRAKWGLAKDYPMVAPNYAQARSNLAKQMGLGQGGRKASAAPKAAVRGRPKAAKA